MSAYKLMSLSPLVLNAVLISFCSCGVRAFINFKGLQSGDENEWKKRTEIIAKALEQFITFSVLPCCTFWAAVMLPQIRWISAEK